MGNKSPDSASGASRFAFVEDSAPSKARSHAMREYWNRRHQRQRRFTYGPGQNVRNLLPRFPQHERSSSHPSKATGDRLCTGEQVHADHRDEDRSNIAVQLLTSLSGALSTSRPDPFQTCPIHLTSQHQKLLHHWICTHAVMMFDDLDAPTFNPMREVWFPLDLSNASSFNCIMAHSAAHLAHLYAGSPPRRGTNSSDALRYKAEAVKILRSWMSVPEKELSDDAFAAVVRLLSFERYWGSDTEWEVHRDGLQKMIEVKGGVGALHNNWRLELVVYLVTLMSRPSWLESTNNVEEISCPLRKRPAPQSPLSSHDLQKVRCLWLISFIQDMRTFMGYFRGAGLPSFPSFYTAIKFLCDNYQLLMKVPQSEPNILGLEYKILACLLTVSIILQEAISLDCEEPPHCKGGAQNVLFFLERTLKDSQDTWNGSVNTLQAILDRSLRDLSKDGDVRISYVEEMVKVLGTLSEEARHGVGKCLLNLLKSSSKSGVVSLIDDGWTPDSLLSSMHGQ